MNDTISNILDFNPVKMFSSCRWKSFKCNACKTETFLIALNLNKFKGSHFFHLFVFCLQSQWVISAKITWHTHFSVWGFLVLLFFLLLFSKKKKKKPQLMTEVTMFKAYSKSCLSIKAWDLQHNTSLMLSLKKDW